MHRDRDESIEREERPRVPGPATTSEPYPKTAVELAWRNVDEKERTRDDDEGTGGTTPGTDVGQSVDQVFPSRKSKSCEAPRPASVFDCVWRRRLAPIPFGPPRPRCTMRTPIRCPGLRTDGRRIVQGPNLAEREHRDQTEHEGDDHTEDRAPCNVLAPSTRLSSVARCVRIQTRKTRGSEKAEDDEDQEKKGELARSAMDGPGYGPRARHFAFSFAWAAARRATGPGRGARHIIQASAWHRSMLTDRPRAHPQIPISSPCGPSGLSDTHPHELTDAFASSVWNGLKGRSPGPRNRGELALRVVTRISKGGLGEIVRAEREELRVRALSIRSEWQPRSSNQSSRTCRSRDALRSMTFFRSASSGVPLDLRSFT